MATIILGVFIGIALCAVAILLFKFRHNVRSFFRRMGWDLVLALIACASLFFSPLTTAANNQVLTIILVIAGIAAVILMVVRHIRYRGRYHP